MIHFFLMDNRGTTNIYVHLIDFIQPAPPCHSNVRLNKVYQHLLQFSINIVIPAMKRGRPGLSSEDQALLCRSYFIM